MFRLTHYMRELVSPTPLRPTTNPVRPVVIWNLIRRCNLACKHCYSISADHEFEGELSTAEIFTVLDDLAAFGVRVLILSGGEPLLRPDIFEISHRAKSLGFYVGLSSNGTLIDEDNIDAIASMSYDYVGVSIDGLGETHDRFRRQAGSFDSAMHGIRLCRDRGIKVGLRFTMTQDNADELPGIIDLTAEEGIDKFYLSHLNYAGRGHRNRKSDVIHRTTRWAMDTLFEVAWRDVTEDRRREIVTGNNDADAVYLLRWAEAVAPTHIEALRRKLVAWGGNGSGVGIANIDNLGVVHPDTFWWHYPLGDVRSAPFSVLWSQTRDPLMLGLRQRPRPVEGRCGSCGHLDVCGGNTRVRAHQTTGNAWAEDPACYLSDAEIGLNPIPEGARIPA